MADTPTARERAENIRQCLSHWVSARVGSLVEGAAFSHITAAVEAEREACAKVAEEHWAGEIGNQYMPSVASAIRARKDKP